MSKKSDGTPKKSLNLDIVELENVRAPEPWICVSITPGPLPCKETY